MANKADINVVLGADFEKSVEQLNKDIAKIEKKINKLNLQVKVQSGNLLTETNNKIAELQKRKTLKQIAINMKLDESKYIKQVNEVEKQLKKLSEQGNINLNVNSNNASANVSNLNTQLKQTTATANTLGSSIKNALSNVGIYINNQTAWLALRQMISDINETIREYDSYVTELALITNRSREEVTGMLEGISETALNLKVDVSDVEKAETTILRAGKSIEETQKLVEDAVKLSTTGFIGTDEAAEHLITIANAYHLEADEMERIADKFVKLDSSANVTAGKLASAIAATASSAQLAGMSIDTLAGYIASLKDTTGRTEQAISTSINTILARMNNIKLNKFEDEIDADQIEVSLNNVERMLNNVNIQLRDSKDEFKDADKVIKEVAEHWKDFTSVEQSSIANVFAGVHNRNVFVSLMENFERAEELANEAANSAGTLTEKYDAYLNSIEAKTAELSTATKELWSNILPADFLGNMTEATTATVKFLDQYKILQTIMKSALFYGAAKGIVFLGDSAKTAWNSVKQLSTAMTALDTAEKSRNTTNYANNLVSLGNACKGLNDKQLQLVLSTKNLTTAEKQQILQLTGLTTEEAAAKIQTLGLATAETTATTATFSLSGALKALWATIVANPIGALTIAFSLVLTAINAVQQAEEEAKQKEKEHAEAIKELANETRNEIEEIDDLYDKYVEIKKAVENGTGSKEELTQVTETLIQRLGLEREEVQKLVDEYGNLDRAITQATADKIKEKLPDLADALKQSGKELYDAAQESVFLIKASDDMIDVVDEFMSQKGGISHADWLSDKDGKKYIVNQNAEGYADLVKGNYTDAAIKAIKEEYQTLTKLREYLFSKGLTDTDTYNSIKDRLADLTPLYNEYIGQLDSYNDQAAQAVVKQKLINSELPKTLDEYISFREDLLKYAQNDENAVLFRGGIEEAQNAVLKQLTSNSFFSEYESKFKDLETLTKEYINEHLDTLGDIEIGSAKFNTLFKKIADAFNDIPIEDFNIATKIPDIFADGLDGVTAKIAEWKANNANKITTDDIVDIDISEVVKTNSAKVKLLTTAMKEMNEEGHISSSTYADIVEQGGNFADCLEIENGKITLNIEKYKALEAQELDNLMIKNAVKMETLNNAKAHSTNTDAINEEIAALERENAFYNSLKNEILSTAPTETKTNTSTADENKQAFEKEYNLRKHWLEIGKDAEDKAYTNEDFYAWLNDREKGYKHYFSDLAKYQTEYFKYEEEVHKWETQNAKDTYNKSLDSLKKQNSGTPEDQMQYFKDWAKLNDDIWKDIDPDKWEENYNEIAKSTKAFYKGLLDNGTYTVEEYKAKINELFKDMSNIGIDLGQSWLADALDIDGIEYDKLKEKLSADGDKLLDDVLADADKLAAKNIELFSDNPKTLKKNAEDILNSVSKSAQDALKRGIITPESFKEIIDKYSTGIDSGIIQEVFDSGFDTIADKAKENLEMMNTTPDEYFKLLDEWGEKLGISKDVIDKLKEAVDEDDYLDRWDLDKGYDSEKSKDDFDLREERIKYIFELAEKLYGKNGQKNVKACNALIKQGLEDEQSLVEDWFDKEIEALEKIKDEQEKIAKAEKLRLNLIKARKKLEEAKNNRNQLVFHNGTFEYMSNQEDVISAQEDYDEAQKAILEEQRDTQIEALKEQKENALDFFKNIENKVGDTLDRITRFLAGDKDAFKVDTSKNSLTSGVESHASTEPTTNNISETNENVTDIAGNVAEVTKTALDIGKLLANGFNFANLVTALGGNPTEEAIKNFKDSYNATLVGKQITPSTVAGAITNNSSTVNTSNRNIQIGDIHMTVNTQGTTEKQVEDILAQFTKELGQAVWQKMIQETYKR